MNRRRPHPLAVTIAVTVLGLGGVVAWQILRMRHAVPTVKLVDRGDPQRGVFVRRAEERESAAIKVALPVWPLRIPVDDAGLLWSIAPRFEYDPACYYRYRGGVDEPCGEFRLRTSLDGFREDFARLPRDIDDLVLVTGDSHTDGLCENSESFANVCERRLTSSTGRRVEVLNAGVTGYGFINYVGVLERFAGLSPRTFVVAFYQGNDFGDCVFTGHYAHCSIPPPRNPAMWKMLKSAARNDPAIMGNSLSQLAWFHMNPDQEEFVRDVALEAVDRIHVRCNEIGARAVFVHIPDCLTFDPRFWPAAERARAEMGLTDDDFARVQRFSDAVLARVRANGDAALDMRAQLLADTSANYWGDMHISTAGHRVIADALAALMEQAWARAKNEGK